MKMVVVLAMHGAPPKDFPREELREFFELHAHHEVHDPMAAGRYSELADKVRRWPRTSENDPYYAASYELAQMVGRESGLEVLVGFNEFCAPDLDEVLARAVGDGAERIIAVTTMMTRGGEHAEREIAQAVSRARQNYPSVDIVYAWPFETVEVASFLAGHIKRFGA
ncbi:MAG: CbiX/SirB N-terminal domain-containing protein [Dehalococcoidia bacterium]|nr:CbiX/SirB N-terminal domain-containing protein [Dehalococcoidia bacterium]